MLGHVSLFSAPVRSDCVIVSFYFRCTAFVSTNTITANAETQCSTYIVNALLLPVVAGEHQFVMNALHRRLANPL